MVFPAGHKSRQPSHWSSHQARLGLRSDHFDGPQICLPVGQEPDIEVAEGPDQRQLKLQRA